ncbi:hypothetical protein [Paenarthrobacter sp. NPDC090522]|uniref:hypothetical protein n=1 Tax=Paenarthrobacter sp. NPDC090522 TaxID=3364383 RepID=UPI00382E43E4
MAEAYWAWGVVNSDAGLRFRRAFLLDSLSANVARLDDVAIPWPDLQTLDRLVNTLFELESGTRANEEEAIGTWWSSADLRIVDWKVALSMPNPSEFQTGITLAELATEIRSGRSFDRGLALTTPTDNALPVVTGGSLSGRPITRWMPEAPGSTTAEVGDLLLAAVGKRANARIARQRSILDSGVYRVRIAEPRLTEAVAGFLNGQEGYGVRNSLVSGSVIPRINLRDLKQIRIPESVLTSDSPPGPLQPLAERLEHLLWAN